MSNLSEIQKQIKAFNKALSRADKADSISNQYYEQIMDLIDYSRMTRSGFAKAGTKYLENMSYRDLMAYQSDIKAAKEIVELSVITSELDIEYAPDVKGALWGMYNKLEDEGIGIDSDQVRDVEKGAFDYRKMLRMMNKLLNDPKYTHGDFAEEWQKEKDKALKE